MENAVCSFATSLHTGLSFQSCLVTLQLALDEKCHQGKASWHGDDREKMPAPERVDLRTPKSQSMAGCTVEPISTLYQK